MLRIILLAMLTIYGMIAALNAVEIMAKIKLKSDRIKVVR